MVIELNNCPQVLQVMKPVTALFVKQAYVACSSSYIPGFGFF
jgi:hypothetical protein